MAERMDNMQQGGCNKTIFSIRAGQSRDKTNTKHEANSRADRTRKNEGIPPPAQPKGRREMYMRPQGSNHGSSPVPLRQDQHTERGPNTPSKSTTKLDGIQTRTYIQTYQNVL